MTPNEKLMTVAWNNTKKAREALDIGADIEYRDEYGRTALMRAASYGCVKTVRMLLDHGADANSRDKRGNTALMYVLRRYQVMRDDEIIIKILLKHKTDVNIINDIGETALNIACEFEHTMMIEKLLDAGADPNIVSEAGLSPLAYWAKYGNVQIMISLVRAGADVNYKDKYNETASDILRKFNPKRYDRWINEMTVEIRRMKLKKEDTICNVGAMPDWNI